MKSHNSHAVPRKVRHTFTTADHVACAVTKSFTREDDNRDLYHPAVDLKTGECTCDCPHFRYRLAAAGSHVALPDTQCKHIQRFVQNLVRKGQLVVEEACEVKEDERPEMDDETARWIAGLI